MIYDSVAQVVFEIKMNLEKIVFNKWSTQKITK